MADEQKDAVVGRVLRERKETENHLASLEAEAQKISENYQRLAELLARHPFDVMFQGQSVNAKYANPRAPLFQVQHFDVSQVIKLTNELRDTQEKLDRLKVEAAKLGF